jgi:hypothetical protein
LIEGFSHLRRGQSLQNLPGSLGGIFSKLQFKFFKFCFSNRLIL